MNLRTTKLKFVSFDCSCAMCDMLYDSSLLTNSIVVSIAENFHCYVNMFLIRFCIIVATFISTRKCLQNHHQNYKHFRQFYTNTSTNFTLRHLELVTSGNFIACHRKLFNSKRPGDHPSAVEVTRK